jgi:hypothetical protein
MSLAGVEQDGECDHVVLIVRGNPSFVAQLTPVVISTYPAAGEFRDRACDSDVAVGDRLVITAAVTASGRAISVGDPHGQRGASSSPG